MTTLDTRQPDAAAPLWQRYRPGHHWRSQDEEFDACKLGFWLFLATEVLLFAGIFCAYAVFRFKYPEAFLNGSQQLDWKWGGLNTVVLLISSYTVAASIRSFQLNRQSAARRYLIITLACALLFLLIKFTFEYMPKWSGWFIAFDPALSHYETAQTAWGGLLHYVDGYGGKRPGFLFAYPFAQDPNEVLWWSLYYSATGIHALHVVIGGALLLWVYVRSLKGAYGPTHYTMVETSGLYWHLVDLVWIFLFPLLYLIH